MTALAWYCRAGDHDRCPLPPPSPELHASCVCRCHHPKEPEVPEPVICPICHRSCAAAAGLASHMRAMHRDEWRRQLEAEAAQPSATRPSVPPPSPSSNGVRWEDPPVPTNGRNATHRIVEAVVPELKRNEGRWARLLDFKGPTSASGHATGLKKAFPDIEIIGRKVGSGSAIFARYVEPSEA